MGRGFKESAHLKTDLKKYHENFDAIDWGNLRERRKRREKTTRMLLVQIKNHQRI
jgi:hypothetical protein